MLAYIITDLSLPRQFLEGALQSATSKSFNTISVDGDQSTSDTVFMLSSKKVEATPADKEEFVNALNSICKELSIDIVRNGEGTQHVVRVTVDGAPSSIFARDLGRFVVNSNLVKCAISGCDPNVGRIVGAIGSFLGKQENGESMAEGLVVTMGGVTIFEEGAFKLDPEKEMMLSDYLFNAQLFPSEVPEHDRTYPPHSKTVDIDILMKSGSESAEVIGSDLTKEYVEVNADYRS
jgi:glutamate N-acetyltransferase/amino-acid N-acetyltransferase